MKIRRVSYFALAAFVFVASCSKEAAEPNVFDWADGKIYFRPSISNVGGSRAQNMTLERLESFQVTCFNTAGASQDASGYLSPHFENATFIRKTDSPLGTTFESSPYEEPHDWPSESGFLRFFAFYPSIDDLGEDSGLVGSDKSYSLGVVRIDSDISRQVDFITAEASGDRWNDFTTGVELAFGHRLCQVELKAWGDGSDYDFEIAGVRIGNPVVEGTFVFVDDDAPEKSSDWKIDGGGVKDKVEYIYQGYGTSEMSDASVDADRIFRINSSEHNTLESAASIMGLGGCAMVIPTLNEKWEGREDPNIDSTPYTTERMYFSLLTRVTEPVSGSVVYPYPGNPKGLKVVSFAVDSSGCVVRRVYAGTSEGEYFTDPELQESYTLEEGMEIKDFGWASVPVDADWSAGKRYVYTLDYSDGIGLHDPEDPDPGTPIVVENSISWGVGVETWNYAEKDENYDPDLNVPEI